MLHTIYKVTNILNGKIYIGVHSTDNPDDNYYGSGKLILRALEKYGIKGFNKEILHTFETKEEMFAKEREIVTQEFVDRRDTYNVNIGGSAPPVAIHTEESRAQVSKRFKGKSISEEHKAKISATKKAGYHPYRGKKLTEEHKEKNRQAQTGRRHSDKTKAKMSANMTGENNPNYGRTFSPEYRAKLSAGQRGRKHSPETKAKMSAARQKHYEDKGNRRKQSERMMGNTNSSQPEKQEVRQRARLQSIKSVIMIGVDYGDQDAYEGVVVGKGDILEHFNTGDFNADLVTAKEFAEGLDGITIYDSSVEDFRIAKFKNNSQKLSQSDIVMIGIDYDEPNPETYRGVRVYDSKNISKLFRTNDYEVDMTRAKEFAFSLGGTVMDSESVDNYLFDRAVTALKESSQSSLFDTQGGAK